MPKEKILNFKQVNCITVMKELKVSNCQIARDLGISEGTVRYRQKRIQQNESDKRMQKAGYNDKYREIIRHWVEDYISTNRRPTTKMLYSYLKQRHEYGATYNTLRRWVKKHLSFFHKKKRWIRIETPPGQLVQIDWKENFRVQVGEYGNWVTMNALVGVLGFSSKMAIVFSEHRDESSFIAGHQRIFLQLGGLPAFIRPDCLKTAITRWNGSNTVLNERYSRYMQRLGIKVFPARPGMATDKARVEKRIKDFFGRMDFEHKCYANMKGLQEDAEALLREWEHEWRCSATGHTVEESFLFEQKELRPLPEEFPIIPLAESMCKVGDEGTVRFGDNYYQVPAAFRGHTILCVNTGKEIILYSDGEAIEQYEYLPHARGMLRLSIKALHDEGVLISERTRCWALEVAQRQVDLYHAIAQQGGRL